MNRRLALYRIAANYHLGAADTRRLKHRLGLASAPDTVTTWVPIGVTALAAGLSGLGLILWVAANWDALGRAGRFALLEGLVIASCLGAAAWPRWRAPMSLLAVLSIGALLAFFGQTYQTGADPWQLFALWALLALPLCLAARSDLLWAPWTLIAMTAITLWTHAYTGHRWWVRSPDLDIHVWSWLMASMLYIALGPRLHPLTGAGIWSRRTATTLAVILVTRAALIGLISDASTSIFWLGLGVLAAATMGLTRVRRSDIYALSVLALSIDTLLVAGLAQWLLDGHDHDPIGPLLFIGLVAATLLAGSVTLILHWSRRTEREIGDG